MSNGSKKMAIPGRFFDLYSSQPYRGEDKVMHDDKTRIHEPILGFYPAHLYLDWNLNNEEREKIETILNNLKKYLKNSSINSVNFNLKSLIYTELGALLNLHLSLLPTLMLPNDIKDCFANDIILISNLFKKFTVKLKNKLSFIPNENKTRLFLVLLVDEETQNFLQLLLSKVIKVLEKYQLSDIRVLQRNMEINEKNDLENDTNTNIETSLETSLKSLKNYNLFHVSIAWFPYSAKIESIDLSDFVVPEFAFSVDSLKFKVGKKVFVSSFVE